MFLLLRIVSSKYISYHDEIDEIKIKKNERRMIVCVSTISFLSDERDFLYKAMSFAERFVNVKVINPLM
jgi:hypothetical protein